MNLMNSSDFLANSMSGRQTWITTLRDCNGILPVILTGFWLMASLQTGKAQMISQYVETNSGTTPKGVEIWNQTGSAIDFSTTPLTIEQGSNGAAPTLAQTVNTGSLAAGAVMVIGTADIGTYLTGQGLTSVTFVSKTFNFNGDDALVVKLNGVVTDELGMPGVDPGTEWALNGVSTKDQNIQLLSGISAGDTDGWGDPSALFETVSTDPSTLPAGLAGFGIAPVTVEDTTPPAISSRTPDIAATDVSIHTSVSITFDEPIAAAAGTVHLFKEAGVSDVEIGIGPVGIVGSEAGFTTSAPLESSETYYVLIDSDAFTDLASPTPNAFPGISSETDWTFTTAAPDVIPPTATLTPADDSTNVPLASDIVLSFDEDVQAGGGVLSLKKTVGDVLVEEFASSDANVDITGGTVTINPSALLEPGTDYYIEAPAGWVSDPASNPSPAITGPTAWNFTTRAAPSVVISQYYEGSGNNKYIELHNLTGGSVSLDGFRLAAWSTSDSPGNQAWKTGVDETTRVTDLTGLTIPANGYFLIGDSAASGPGYAVNNTDLWQAYPSGISFAGVASVVLYSSATNDLASVEDAVSITANEGTDTSFYRLNNDQGYDFASGSSILDYPSVWGTKTDAEVDAALASDDWYLHASLPPVALTLDLSTTTFSESAGDGAATATVTRDGSTDSDLEVTVTTSDFTEAYAQFSVTIPTGSSEASFPIDAIDDLYLDGDQQVTVSVSSYGFSPDSQIITVTDDLTDAEFPLVINEVDADQAGTDTAEFVELHNTSSSEVSLDDVVLVFYNGNDDLSYYTVDLTGEVIAPNGYYVVGNSAVANVNLTFADNKIQNGADAVALYIGTAADFPTSTPVTTTHGTLVDALVYDTNDADDTGLIAALTPGKPQTDEGSSPASETVSLSRASDGGAAFDTTIYIAQAPTPGATNMLTVPNTLSDWIAGFDVGAETGVNGDFDNDGMANAVENILGSDPSVFNSGLSAVSSTANSVTFRHTLSATPASDLTASYEWSTDLATWVPDGGSNGTVAVSFGAPSVIIAGPPDMVEVTATADGPLGTLFARLKVTNP